MALKTDRNQLSTGGSNNRCDDAAHGGPFSLGDATWYRLPPGRGLNLPRTPPATFRCDTGVTSWLSGFGESAAVCHNGAPYGDGAVGACPDRHYSSLADAALPPVAGTSEVAGTVCFNNGGGDTCYYSVQVRSVGCGAFALWWLPPSPPFGGMTYCLEG